LANPHGFVLSVRGDEPEALQNKVQVKEQVLNLLETNISLSDRVQRAQDSFGVPGLNDQDAGFTFTGLTLASVDSLSLIPLPVSSLELANGRFYEPEYCRAVQSQLDALVEANVKEKNRPLARILGLREPPSKLEDDRVGRRMTSIFGSRSKK
jgi:hypothetical protein